MKVAAIQHDVIWESPSANHERLTPMVSQAASCGAELVVLSEMYSTGFSMSSDKIAEKPEGESETFLSEQAKTNNLWMAASVPTKDLEDELPVNRFLVKGPSGESYEYDKVFPFTFAGEHENYRAGSQFVTIDLMGVRTSLFVCYDLRFADAFWNLVYGSSFVSGVEKCISDHNPAIITIVQNIGQAIFLPIFSNVPSLLSEAFFCFGFLFLI